MQSLRTVRPAEIDWLIEHHGADMRLPELCNVLTRDCPRVEAVAVGEHRDLYYP